MLNKARKAMATAAVTLATAGVLLSGAGTASASTPPLGGGGSLVHSGTYDWEWTCMTSGNWLIVNGRISGYQCWDNGYGDWNLMVKY